MSFFDGIVNAVGDLFSSGPELLNSVGPYAAEAAGDSFGIPGLGNIFGSMGSIGSAIGSLGGVVKDFSPLISGTAGYFGQQSANETNMELADKQMAFQRESQNIQNSSNAYQASVVRDWEENLSNTAWQRGVKDMQAAGINPMLAFMKGGASTPTSSPASGSAPMGAMARVENAAGAGINSAFQAANVRATLAGASKAESESALNYVLADKAAQDTRTSAASAYELTSRGALNSVTYNYVLDQIDNIRERTGLTAEQTRLARQQVLNAVSEGRRIEAHTGNILADTLLRQLEVPGARNRAESERKHPTLYQDVVPFVSPGAKALGSAAGAAWLLK